MIGTIKAESLADPNVLWETRDGLDIISTGALPRADHWSWTVHGKPWTPNSWGWDWTLGLLYRLGGAGALAMLNIVLVLALVAGMTRVAYRSHARPLAVFASVGVVGAVILLPWLNDRPQLISYLFVLILVSGVRLALATKRRTFFLLLSAEVALEALWVNLHFVAIIGPGLVAAAGVGHLLAQVRSRLGRMVRLREQALRLTAGVVLALAACGITPYGPIVVAKSFAVHNDAAGLVLEWKYAGFATYTQFTGVLAIAVACVAIVHSYRARRWDLTAVLGVLAISTAIVCRMAPITAVVALPEMALALTPVLARVGWRRATTVLTAAAVIAGVGVVAADAPSFADFKPASVSPTLLARVPSGCRLVNDYPLGGAVIMFRPDVPVAVDSRTDLYGRQRILANRRLVAGRDDALARLDATRVGCVLVPTRSGLAKLLNTDPQWRSAGTDAERSLFVRS